MAEDTRAPDAEAAAGPGSAGGPARRTRTSRLGLTNLYLTTGLCALIAGLACTALLVTRPAGSAATPWLGWAAASGVLGGVVLYAIGRIVQIVERRSRA